MTTNLKASPNLLAACVLGAALVAAAAFQSPAARTEHIIPQPTVAVVDLTLINGLMEYKDRNKLVEAHAEELKKVIEETGNQIKAIETELQTVIPATDAKRRSAKAAQKLELIGQFDARKKIYQQIINLEQGDVVRELYDKLVAKVAEIAKKDGIDLVLLDDSSLQIPERATAEEFGGLLRQRGVLYRNPGLDITSRVLTNMNNDYAGGAGAAPAAPAPAAPAPAAGAANK